MRLYSASCGSSSGGGGGRRRRDPRAQRLLGLHRPRPEDVPDGPHPQKHHEQRKKRPLYGVCPAQHVAGGGPLVLPAAREQAHGHPGECQDVPEHHRGVRNRRTGRQPTPTRQSKTGPTSRVRLISKKPGVPATSSVPSQSRPAASPFGAGRDDGAEEGDELAVLARHVDDGRADVHAHRVHPGEVALPQRLVVLGRVGGIGERPAGPRRRARLDSSGPSSCFSWWIRVPSAV